MAAVEALQRLIWPGDDLEIAPGHLLLTAAHNGGLLAGAWAEDRLVGFVFGFLGFEGHGPERRLKHCSHMLGVHPSFRNSGIGAALKAYQRDFVLRQGLDLITWTYDPLLARNAQLNIARLGAICDTYLPDLYGPMRDGLNAGLPSDRFQVAWWINTPHVAERLAGATTRPGRLAEHLAAGATLVNPPGDDGAPRPPAPPFDAPAADIVLVEIPADFLALKAADPALALRWRLAARGAFAARFAQGYVVTDFVRDAGRAVYVLRRERPSPQEKSHAH